MKPVVLLTVLAACLVAVLADGNLRSRKLLESDSLVETDSLEAFSADDVFNPRALFEQTKSAKAKAKASAKAEAKGKRRLKHKHKHTHTHKIGAPATRDGEDSAPASPVVTGDPHFVQWSGQKFDFHGGCDLVLVQNPEFNDNQGMYIHIRTKIQRWWSYVDSAVVQIGSDTLEVMGGVETKRYFVNGEAGGELSVNGMMPFTIGGYPVRYRNLGPNMFQLKIFLDNDQVIVMKAVKDFMRVDIENPLKGDFESSVGLMGSYHAVGMFGRDGETEYTDENDFGMEWQVQQDEPMLFHNVEGTQFPEKCAMPTVAEDSRRLEESISREDAELACSKVAADDLLDCVSDVMATSDTDMAGAF